MGTVYRRGRKLWVGFVGPSGKWVYRSSGYDLGQRLLAEKLVDELEAQVRQGLDPVRVSLAEYAARWAKKRITKGKHTNAKLDARAVAQHIIGAELELDGRELIFGDLDVREVRLEHVRAFMEALELKNIGTAEKPDHLAPRTRRGIYSLLKRLFLDAERSRLVDRSPCLLERNEWPQLIDKDINWRPGAVFTLPEAERLVSDARVPLDRRVFYALGLLGGLREGEIAALRWDAYDPDRGQLGGLQVRASYTRKNKRETPPKSKLARAVPVHPVTAALLAEFRLSGWKELFGRQPEPKDLLVPNRNGVYVTDMNVSENFGRDLEVLGMRHRRFHDTRRTFVTLARAGGAGAFLSWVSHGPSKAMLDVYTTAPWANLCAEVLCIKAQLRGAAALLPLSAARGVSGGTTLSTTNRGRRMKATEHQEQPSALGEIRTRTPATGSEALHGVSPASLRSIASAGHDRRTERSNATTDRRPFRGGMRIEDDEPQPELRRAGVRRG